MGNDPPPVKSAVQEVPVEFDLSDRISSRMSSRLSAFGGQILVALACTLGAVILREMTDMFVTAGAGPFMLVNETLEAFRQRSVGPVTLAGSIALALTWVFLTGIVVADLAIFVGHLVA